MKALIIGASAGVGRALSEALAAHGDELLLVASDERDLQVQASHLRLVYDVHVEILSCDASHPLECLKNICSAAETFGCFDGMFFPVGLSRPDDLGLLPFAKVQQLFDVNLVTIVGVIGQFLPGLLASDHGVIVGFGSVAAIRGRRANIVYAAAKRGLESYFESLRHLAANTKVRVQFYKLGYISTQQSFGKKLLFPQISPQLVAKTVVNNLESNHGIIYLPRFWSIIAHFISTLPWFIFRRIDF
jgi:short-subunit dehydrogenase